MKIALIVNGRRHELDAAPDTPLLWVLRDQLGLTGTKYGCGIAQCGACTVHVGGRAARACVTPISSLEGAKITTIEGLAQDERLHPVQQAWIDEDVPQCGYCQAGQIMAVTALLEAGRIEDEADLDGALSNICRCGTYPRIRRAVRRVLAKAASAPESDPDLGPKPDREPEPEVSS